MRLWTYVYREMRGRTGRTLLTLLGIALGTATVSATTLTNQAVRRAYRDLSERLVGPAALEAAAPGQGGFDPDRAGRLADVPGVKAVVPRIQAAAALVGPSGADPVLVVGAAFAGSPARRPLGDEDILLDAGFLREHGLAVGDRVSLWTAAGLSELHVAGTLEADGKTALSGMPLARASLAAAQRWFDLPHRVNSLQIILEDGANPRRVAAEAATRLPVGVGLQAPDARAEMAHATLLSTEQGLTCLGVAAMLGAGFVIFNTFLLNVGERRRQLATFRVIGATRGQVVRMLLGEAAVLGLAGTLLGAGGGLGLAVLLIRAMGRFMGVAPPSPHADAAFFLALLTGPAAAVGAALVPSWIAVRREPLKELRMPQGGGTNLVPRWVCFPGVLLLVAAAALGTGLSQGWLRPATAQRLLAPGVAALLIGGVLALPLVLTPLLRLFGWLLRPMLGVEGAFALRQMTGRGSRTGLTVGVLFLAVVMAVGFGHWLRGSLRDLRHWYTRTIVADYLIRAAMPDTAFLLATPLPEGLAAEIAGQEGVARVDKLSFVPARVNGRQVLVLARTFSASGPLPLDLREGEAAAVRRGLMAGDAVLGVGLARSLRLGVGDIFSLETAHGPESVRVAGTATEYAAGGGALYLEWGAARRLLDVSGAHVFLVSAREGKARPLQRSLKALCGRRHLLLQSNEALRVLIDGLLAKVVAALWAILALTFLIASLGMVNTLTLNIMEQARDLRVLRVVGMTRGQIVRVVLWQAVLMGLAGLAPGTVVGLCLDYFLTSPGNLAVIQSSPFRVDAAVIAVCWAAGLAAATLAALGPAFRAGRLEAIQTTHSS